MNQQLADYMTATQAAEISGYTDRMVRYLIKRKKIEAIKIGIMWFISIDSFNAYLKEVEEKSKSDKRYKNVSDY